MLLGSDIHTIPVLEYGFSGKVCLGSVLVGVCLFVVLFTCLILFWFFSLGCEGFVGFFVVSWGVFWLFC